MIDTHIHVVAADRERYPLQPRDLSGQWYLDAPHSAEQLLECMDTAGVSHGVLVQAVGAYTFDNSYAADSARTHPTRFASACCIDPVAEGAVDLLRHWVRERGMQGIRIFAVSSPLDDPRSFPVWEAARDLGIHVIVTHLSNQYAALQRMLRRYPEIAVSLDHCGFPDPADPEPLLTLADEPNLHCKVSSVVLESQADRAAAFVEILVKHFGSERVMWGSDFSQTHDRTYSELVALARNAFSGLRESDQQQCFVGTPRALWPSLAGPLSNSR